MSLQIEPRIAAVASELADTLKSQDCSIFFASCVHDLTEVFCILGCKDHSTLTQTGTLFHLNDVALTIGLAELVFQALKLHTLASEIDLFGNFHALLVLLSECFEGIV